MSFSIYDSQDQVDEVELYLFTTIGTGDTLEVFGFTSSPSDVTVTVPVAPNDEVIFVADAISRGPIVTPVVGASSTISMKAHPNCEFAKRLSLGEYGSEVTLTIMKMAPDESLAVRWTGYITQAVYKPTDIKLTAVSVLEKLKRSLRTKSIEVTCPWQVYSSRCKAQKSASNTQLALVTGVLDEFNGVVTLDPQISYYDHESYVGGEIEVGGRTSVIQSTEGVTEYTFTLTDPTVLTGVSVGDEANISFGCNKSQDECLDRFNNLISFGGFPKISVEGV
jgi:hypothetical protein